MFMAIIHLKPFDLFVNQCCQFADVCVAHVRGVLRGHFQIPTLFSLHVNALLLPRLIVSVEITAGRILCERLSDQQ